MSKYVFFDIDGTIWDEQMVVPESTKIAIKKLQENGHKAFICTGRARGNVCDPQLTELNFDGVVAACGNHIEMDGEIIYERILSKETVKRIYDSTREHQMPVVLEGPFYQWVDANGFEGDSYISYIVEKLVDRAITLDKYDENIRINKFSALLNENTNYEAVKEELSDEFEFLEHGEGIIEAVPKGTSKATGIQWMCEHLNIPLEDTYAIGDSVNDLDMLQFVGHGIAMGNASQVAKDVSEYVTDHIHEDGIYHALEHYGLI